MHAHRCGHCRYVFTHEGEAFNNAGAHLCPRCGAGPWWDIFDDTKIELPFIVLLVLVCLAATLIIVIAFVLRSQS